MGASSSRSEVREFELQVPPFTWPLEVGNSHCAVVESQARSLVAAGRVAQAKALLLASAFSADAPASLLSTFGYCLVLLNDFSRARDAFQRALEKSSETDDASLRLALGWCQQRCGNWLAAEESFSSLVTVKATTAVARDSSVSTVAQLGLAACYRKRAKLAEAADVLRAVLRTDRLCLDAWKDLAEVLVERGERDSGIDTYRSLLSCLEISPKWREPLRLCKLVSFFSRR